MGDNKGLCTIDNDCQKKCQASKPKAITDDEGYKCDGNDNCFCKFTVKKDLNALRRPGEGKDFFAERIRASIARRGTDDKAQVKSTVFRENTAPENQNLYDMTLQSDVVRDLQLLYNARYKELILDIITINT
jgi:hypothetical protein